MKFKIYLIDFIFTLMLLFSILLSICLGSITLNPLNTLKYLMNSNNDNIIKIIIYEVRLPRIIGCIAVGFALSIAGLVLQTIFRNPLVDPYTLGIANGALFFIGLGIILGLTIFNISITTHTIITCSIIGAGITLIILTILAPILSTIQLLIVGITISFLYSAGTYIIVSLAEIEKIAYLHLALLGSFSGITWDKLLITLPIIITCSIIILFQSKWLNTFLMSEEYAITMGTNVRIVKFLSIICAGVLTAISVSLAGIVGFIGLATPHIVRLIYRTSRIEFLFPRILIIGSLITLTSDTIARIVLLPRELPVTAITSLFGAPLLTYLVIRLRKEYVV